MLVFIHDSHLYTCMLVITASPSFLFSLVSVFMDTGLLICDIDDLSSVLYMYMYCHVGKHVGIISHKLGIIKHANM